MSIERVAAACVLWGWGGRQKGIVRYSQYEGRGRGCGSDEEREGKRGSRGRRGGGGNGGRGISMG